MDSVNKTLYIPLYGKAYASKQGILLRDEKAEEIWKKEQFPLKGKAASKWLAYTMAVRAAVFDQWTAEMLETHPNAAVVHIGCGLDSRCLRVESTGNLWYDIDFADVIRERRKYFDESDRYRMVAADMRTDAWKEELPAGGTAIIVMEGVSMYFRRKELVKLLAELKAQFSEVHLLMDCYSVFGAKASKYKNPINQVGVTTVYGLDDAENLAAEAGFRYTAEHDLTPESMILQLKKREQGIFRSFFAGKMARRIYRLYEFDTKKEPA